MAETQMRYKIDQTQRQLEREIRRKKESAILNGLYDRDRERELYAQARDMTAKYRAFCRKYNTVAMIYRTQVTTEERQLKALQNT